MPYYHVLLRLRGESDTDRCVFSDLPEKELRGRFVTPYQSGRDFLSGTEVISSAAIKKTTIIRTDQPSADALRKIQEQSRRENDDLNRSSRGVVFLGLGSGYAPEDIAEAGEDVTATYILGPPGQGGRWAVIAAIMNHPWISAIGTSLIVGALLWLFGLT